MSPRLLTLDGKPLTWAELHERNRVWHERKDSLFRERSAARTGRRARPGTTITRSGRIYLRTVRELKET